MGYRRLQKRLAKYQSKEKPSPKDQSVKEWKKSDKSFQKYRKIKWSDDDIMTEA